VTMTAPLHPALERYVRSLPQIADRSTASLFWERLLERFDSTAPLEDAATEQVERLIATAQYGFEDLPADITDPREDVAFREASAALPGVRRIAKQLSPKALGLDKPTWEHLNALAFLERGGLLKGYLAFIAPLRVRSSMSTARHWYYARQFCALAARTHGDRELDVLEIGAGAGNLAYFLTLMGRVRSYTIVDLPQMLIHAGYTVQRRIPQFALHFDCPPGEARTFTLISDFRATELMDAQAFDAAINMNSFMEMDRNVRDDYIGLVYRTARPNALFFNVNRRQAALPLRDGGTWDNNPLLYPYRPDDEVLLWEEDSFQTATRVAWGKQATLTVTRAARIHPAPDVPVQPSQ
jgi:hypothetical protein